MQIVFDIGATKMRIAGSEDGITLGEPIIHQTPEQFKDGISLLAKSIKELSKHKVVTTISGGVAGIIDKPKGIVLHSPNLRGWENHSFFEKLEKICGQVFIENDAAMSALGEATQGAGRGNQIVVYITISTGIGGARVVDGKIDTRRVSFEPGQQIIDRETLSSLESIASGRALEKRYGKEPRFIEDERIWKKVTEDFAIGLHNTILHWSPDVVVLGGPMILKKPGIDIEYLKEYLKTIMIMFPTLPEIKLAELGDSNGLIGALEYARLQTNP